jgi:hypothetical protein
VFGKTNNTIIVIMLMLVIVIAVSIYYLFVMKHFSERLNWVSGMYSKCQESSIDVRPGELYRDLEEVMQGQYDKKKLLFYTNKIKQHSEGKCSKSDVVVCEDSYLYVLRTFLARGNEKDLNLAFSMLNKYKQMQGVNIYSDALFLEVSLYYAWANEVQEGYYSQLLERASRHSVGSNYFKKPHGGKVCDVYLDLLGAVYAKSGDNAADLYIQYYIRK